MTARNFLTGLYWSLVAALALSVPLSAAEPGRIPGIGPAGRIVRVRGGFQFTEGPAADAKGNLYITSALGIQVFTPQGKLLGIIKFPEQPANVTFGGKDMKTLYATARTSLYAAEMEATGHAFPGKAP